MTTTEQARLLEKAKVGTAPDCANVDSFTIPLFIEQGVLAAARQVLHARAARDLFPNVRKVMTGPDGHIYAWWWSTDLRVLYRRTDLVPKAPKTWDQLIAVRAGGQEEGPEGRRLPVQRRALGGDDVRQPRLLLDAGREAARRARASRCSRRAPTATAMLNVFKLVKRTIDTGVTPSRVTTFNTYDEMSTAAAGRDRGDVPRRLVPVADDEGAARQGLRQVGGLRAARTQAGETATGTGGWSVAAFSKDPEKVAACMDIVRSIYAGAGNELTGELPTSQKSVRHAEGVPAADLQAVP